MDRGKLLRFFWFYGLVLFFRLMLDVSYIGFVSIVFVSSGFDINPSLSGYLISWLLTVGSLPILSNKLCRVSDYLFLLSVSTLILPLASLYGLSGRELFPLAVTFLSIVLIKCIVHFVPVVAIRLPVKNGVRHATFLSLFMVCLLIVWYIISGATDYFNLSPAKVYEYREASAKVANVGMMAYVNSWVYQIFSMFAFSVFLYRKKYFFAFFVFVVQVFFYGVSAHKSVLLYPFMILSVWAYLRKSRDLSFVILLFCLIVIAGVTSWYLFDDVWIGSLFIRRVFYVPALLTYDYFNFFQDNERIFWSNSILSDFSDYPHDLGLAYLIGDYNGSGASANNGLISSGYAHAGLFGVVIYSIVFGLLIKIIDITSKSMPIWFALCLVIIPYRNALISSDLLTVLLTHGLLLACFLLLLSSRSFSIVKNNGYFSKA